MSPVRDEPYWVEYGAFRGIFERPIRHGDIPRGMGIIWTSLAQITDEERERQRQRTSVSPRPDSQVIVIQEERAPKVILWH